MRIRVDEIPDSGRIVRLHWDEGNLEEFMPPDDPFELELVRPVDVDLQVHKNPDHIRVQGSISGLLQVTCHRCLKPFHFDLDEAVDVFLVDEQERPEDEDEQEIDTEELEFEYFDGEAIDLDRLIAEQVFLALPFKVLCSEDCRGLCPGCGANLNDEPCACDKGQPKGAFAGLAAVKSKLPKSSDS